MELEPEVQINNRIQYPEWQGVYEDALTEFNSEKLVERIAMAEAAMFERAQAIAADSLRHREMQAMEDALAFLRALKPAARVSS